MCGVKAKRNEKGVSKRQVKELKERLDAFLTKGKLLERRGESEEQHYPVPPVLWWKTNDSLFPRTRIKQFSKLDDK